LNAAQKNHLRIACWIRLFIGLGPMVRAMEIELTSFVAIFVCVRTSAPSATKTELNGSGYNTTLIYVMQNPRTI
jgi:hypothetical protein